MGTDFGCLDLIAGCQPLRLLGEIEVFNGYKG